MVGVPWRTQPQNTAADPAELTANDDQHFRLTSGFAYDVPHCK
jgi:hypothetical protein